MDLLRSIAATLLLSAIVCGHPAFGNDKNSLSLKEADDLRQQIEQCWNPPAVGQAPENSVVDVTITVNPDRTVKNVEVVDKKKMETNPDFRKSAEAAIHALFNPRCSPLHLPEGKYEQWKTLSFTFDAKDML